MKSATRCFSVRYSALWLTGGGGVKPIHITRFTVPLAPVDPVPPLLEQAAASSVRAAAAGTPTRHMMRLRVLILPMYASPCAKPLVQITGGTLPREWPHSTIRIAVLV